MWDGDHREGEQGCVVYVTVSAVVVVVVSGSDTSGSLRREKIFIKAFEKVPYNIF